MAERSPSGTGRWSTKRLHSTRAVRQTFSGRWYGTRLGGLAAAERKLDQHSAILSMYMFAEYLDCSENKKEFGSLTYSVRYHTGGALDTVDQVMMNADSKQLSITAQNMMSSVQTYSLRLLDPERRLKSKGKGTGGSKSNPGSL